ncbi:MAG: glycosyltransferase family 2 protein [Candidatus Omnitrophota bacterium]
MPVNETLIRISLVIPYYKSLNYIKNCLEGIHAHTLYPIHEVVIVNDGSPDSPDLQLFIDDVKERVNFDIRFINRSENRGFAYTCNEGAALATGDYILFLNADTIPIPGWLTALVRFLTQHPHAGILGSCLLFPGVNRIQHAGGAFNHQKKPFHIYKGQPPFLPFLNKPRLLQWVTGACLLIKTSDFHAVGGFDESFISSSEDVDLCFKVRFNLGKEVWMVPDSRLYHYVDVTGVTSKNIERTHAMFIDRWHSRIIPDEDAIYESDGFAPELIHLLEQCGIYNDFNAVSTIIEMLNMNGIQSQREYVKIQGTAGFMRDLEAIGREFPGYDWFKKTNPMTLATISSTSTSHHQTSDVFQIQQLIHALSNALISQSQKQRLLSQLTERLDSTHWLTILYNIASMLSLNHSENDREHAMHLFSFLSSFAAHSNPQLAGKALFKLSELTPDNDEKKAYLSRCLMLYPDHRLAKDRLMEVNG